MADLPVMTTRVFGAIVARLGRGALAWLEELRRSNNARANKIVDGTSGHLVIQAADGDIQDSGTGPPAGDYVGTTQTQTLTNKTLVSPILSAATALRLLASDANKVPVSVEDLTAWIAGGNTITITNDGNGTITVAVKINEDNGIVSDADGLALELKANFGLTVDADGLALELKPNFGLAVDAAGLALELKPNFGLAVDAAGLALKQQAHVADASASHTIADTAETCDRSDIEDKLDALGAKINTVLAALEAADILATA